jgi:hypothetical protein
VAGPASTGPSWCDATSGYGVDGSATAPRQQRFRSGQTCLYRYKEEGEPTRALEANSTEGLLRGTSSLASRVLIVVFGVRVEGRAPKPRVEASRQIPLSGLRLR